MGMTGCRNCYVFQDCGGDELPIIRELGCANYSKKSGLVDSGDMNPAQEGKFWKFWDDVDGLRDYSTASLLAVDSTGLPTYIPLLQHPYAKHGRLLDARVVAIRLFEVLGRRKGGGYGPKYGSGSELRAAYSLRPGTDIILVGVDEDAPLEQFWAEHGVSGACESLVKLGLLGVTVPNYSFFTCVSRFQILRNRKRLLLAAERLSTAGVRVAPHLNANNESDWKFWKGFLLEHTEVNVVTVEFQTGARADEKFGRWTFDQLLALQDSVARPLRPFLIGAGRYYKEAAREFESFSVIDSRPFMFAMSRQIIFKSPLGRFILKKFPTGPGAPLHHLMEVNFRLYPAMLAAEVGECVPAEQDPRQLSWDLCTSTPYLISQPRAFGI
jgi:hypothetical protein